LLVRRALLTLVLTLAFAAPAGAANPMDGEGMWVWVVQRSHGGNPDRMAQKALKHGVDTVIIKAADARTRWRQVSPRLISRLKSYGLRVCGYQFVYGRYPKTEAARGAQAARAGADCLMIDAEGHYEGKYVSAQTYIKRLRARVGPHYPLGLTSFPYVHYHPTFPYSVFLGPGGAQFNVPQMYWKTIGVSVDRIFSITYTYNRLYKRPIHPLGQTYSNPSPGQVRRFRRLAQAYGAPGVSWWVWQFSGNRQWNALSSIFDPIASPRVAQGHPLLRRGYRSDLVVWAQQHLMAHGLLRTVNGRFGSGTQNAVATFQATRGLPITGRIDNPTWQALLTVNPAPVRWRRAGGAVAASAGGTMVPRHLGAPRGRNELRGKPRG
jgi:hypothetical protein